MRSARTKAVAPSPALKRYIEHDAHQRFIARNKASWERVLVVDTELSQLQT